MHVAPTLPAPTAVPARRHGLARAAAPFAAAVVALVLTGCGSGGDDLAGGTYTSTSATGHELVPGSTVTLTLADGRISANAGCNTMNGTATWDGDTLEVTGPLASTMMACEDALMQQDQWLSEFLTSSPALELDGDVLTLGDSDDGLTLQQKV